MALAEEGVAAAKGQMVAFYYETTGGGPLGAEDCSDEMDGFGWNSGWRAADDAEILWNSQCGGNWMFFGTPSAFIIDVSTMTLHDSSLYWIWAKDAQAFND